MESNDNKESEDVWDDVDTTDASCLPQIDGKAFGSGTTEGFRIQGETREAYIQTEDPVPIKE